MKRIPLIILILFASISCSQTNPKNNVLNNEMKKNNEMKTRYILNYSIPYPAEILINDMIAEIDLNQGLYPPCSLNEFFIPSKTQNIKIKIFSPNKKIDAITNNLIKKINEDFV